MTLVRHAVNFFSGCLVVGACVGPMVSAQTGSSGLAGVVRDSTGAVLPGVTVEASSPALIEKVRLATTDGMGQYRIVDLRPGTYSVTFSLPGFSNVRREGVILTANFTATINVDLSIGTLDETVTVSGQSPVVDVQNTAPRNIISETVLNAVPSARAFTAYAALTPSVQIASTAQDVGGSKGDTMVWLTAHGSSTQDSKIALGGFETNFGAGNRLFIPNPYDAQEISLDLGGGTAEQRVGGVGLNFIPKVGANEFSGDLFGSFANEGMQNSNFTDDLAARGLDPDTLNRVNNLWDFNVGFGGPVSRDHLWFFGSYRNWGGSSFVAGLFENKTVSSFPPVYTADLENPALNDFESHTSAVRLTWQAAERHKVSVSFDWQERCDCHRDITPLFSPEAVARRTYTPVNILLATWNSPVSNKLLLEGGIASNWNTLNAAPQPEVVPEAIAVLEQTTGFSYGAMFRQQENNYSIFETFKIQPRFSVQYVTGTHSVKAGVDAIWDLFRWDQFVPNNLKYTLRNGAPVSLQQFAMPNTTKNNASPDLGLFVQDQWTLRRLTLNLGLRLDYLRINIPAFQLPAVQFRPEVIDLPAVDCAACLTDVEPRVSAAYDLFGTGKTALKVNIGRFASGRSLVTNNPSGNLVTNASRAWTDANGNFLPDCDLLNLNLQDLRASGGDLCGRISNSLFGQSVPGTSLSDDVIRGVRRYNWQFSAAVQHELYPGVAVDLGYFRTNWHGVVITDNLLVTPADYDPYCITLPSDPQLPGGGGNTLCGLYDITPEKFGEVDNIRTLSSNFGDHKEVYSGVDLNVTARFRNGAYLSGGASMGRTDTDACYTIDSPQALLFCHVVEPFRTQLKLNGVVPLPLDFQVAATLQSLPGIPISASYVATNAEIAPSLGRDLAGNRATVSISDVIPPQTVFEDRMNQLDARLTKAFQIGTKRLIAHLDVYNVFNGNTVLSINTNYGPSWLNATQILDARLFRVSAQFMF
jgi:carboxypeptidase family protein